MSALACLLLLCFMTITTGPVYAADKPLKGKKVLIEGDSLQYGFGKYIEVSVKAMGAKKVKNIAKNNATIGVSPIGDVSNCSYYRIKGLSGKTLRKYDYIIIATGTNDYFSGYKIRPGVVDSTAKETTAGALNMIIKKIRKQAPKAKIVLVTPIHRLSGKTSCDLKRNRYGKTLKDYRKIISKVANKYNDDNKHVYVIQGTKLSKIWEMRKHKNSADGTHPTDHYAKKVLAKRFRKEFCKTVLDQ